MSEKETCELVINIGSSAVTSISLFGPFRTSVKYRTQESRVQETLASQIEEDKISVLPKGCCLTGNNKCCNSEASPDQRCLIQHSA